MKANPWLLPGAALLVTGGWIVSQKQSAATLEREITQITERIHQARAVADAESAAGDTADKAGKDKDGKIDWKELAGKMGSMRNGTMSDMRAFMRMQRVLLEMSVEELCAQLDEIAALDLEDAARSQLRAMIVGALVEKDPKLALDRFGGELTDDRSGIGWQLSNALGKWADENPAEAVAWLDQQIAAGKFESKSLDGKNQFLVRFEAGLVEALLKTDPAAATARVSAMPEVQREELFQQGWFFQLKPEHEAAFAKLARDSMPADKVGGILARKAGMLAMQGDFERVDGFIASTNATDDEKSAIVANVMERKLSENRKGEVDEETLENVRNWAAGQSPASVDTATGEGLGNALWREGDFDKISALALKYHESTGSDEVLAAFLKSSAARNRSADEARVLIEEIRDPELREEIRALDEYKTKP